MYPSQKRKKERMGVGCEWRDKRVASFPLRNSIEETMRVYTCRGVTNRRLYREIIGLVGTSVETIKKKENGNDGCTCVVNFFLSVIFHFSVDICTYIYIYTHASRYTCWCIFQCGPIFAFPF